jgi:hypothetical protein
MDRNISHSTAYFVLDDDKYQPVLRPPPGLYQPQTQTLTPVSYQPQSYQSIYQPVQPVQPVQSVQSNPKMTQIIENYIPYEPNKDIEKKKKLEHDLVVAKQIVSLLEKELTKINELIEVEKTVNIQENITPVINDQVEIQDENISKPTDKFIKAIYALFMKESPIMLSNIPHKLPRNVLPPKGHHGLFTKWMNQVPGSQYQIVPCLDVSRKQYMYWIDHISIKKTKTIKEKTCFQKLKGKPCNLNDKGECKYCK